MRTWLLTGVLVVPLLLGTFIPIRTGIGSPTRSADTPTPMLTTDHTGGLSDILTSTTTGSPDTVGLVMRPSTRTSSVSPTVSDTSGGSNGTGDARSGDPLPALLALSVLLNIFLGIAYVISDRTNDELADTILYDLADSDNDYVRAHAKRLAAQRSRP